jgi:hypothetical protein
VSSRALSRSRLALGAAAIAAAAGVAISRAQDDESSAGELSKEAQAVLNGGLAYLADRNQQSDDNGGVNANGTNESWRLATTSLAGLAWLAAGSTPTRGPYRDNVRKAIDYVLSKRDRSPSRPAGFTYFGNPAADQSGRMHAHGFAMLFLAEAYGMLGSAARDRANRDSALAQELRSTLEGAVKLSVASQTKDKGGWGYAFAGEGAFDLDVDEASTTITQIQGLRAARNAGISVPSKTIDRAVKYVKRCVGEAGDCCYSLTMPDGQRTTFELTAAAVSTLNAAGTYRSDKLDLALGYMRREMARHEKPTLACQNYYFYGNLYAAQAMFQAGGADWASWWKGAQEDLVAKAQRGRDGQVFWTETNPLAGPAYATASACLILSIPMRYLPIFER